MSLFSYPTRLALPLLVAATLSGCSAMRSYDDELKQTLDLIGHGHVDQALQQHEANNSGGNFDLLYYLEKGELLRLQNQYKDSASAWLLADQKVNEWENEAKIRAGAILENVGAVVLNDKTRRYDGHDYEKVMLSTQLALDHVLLGDWNSARTEIKKTHEREALIAEVNAKNTEEVEKESKEKGITTTFKDLNGYPVQTLNAPEVTALKNGYQSAFSHYLAGFVYEALNEPGLASPGYRQAIELQPNVKILEQGLATLDTRPALRKPNETDVLLVVETGAAPALTSVTIPVPVIVSNLGVIPISFPVLHSDPSHTLQPSSITIDGKDSLPLATITSIDAMSKRALRDDMPGIIVRGIIRAAAKTMSQKALMDQGGGAAIAGIALNIANVVTESADERTWRTLPSTISIARMTLPSGKHDITVGNSKQAIDIKGSHAIVVARLLGNQTYWSQPIFGPQTPVYTAPAVVQESEVTENTPTVETNKKSAKAKKKKK
ncbi:MAG: COG3014 family protein [Methylobacter sp.]